MKTKRLIGRNNHRLHSAIRRGVEALEGRAMLASTLPAGFAESVYASGFDTPTAQAFAPDGRLFVLEKAGKVRVVTPQGALNSTPYLSLNVATDQDRGLVALAFDPDFAVNRYLYLWDTTTDATGTRNRLSRFQSDATNPKHRRARAVKRFCSKFHTTPTSTPAGAMGFGADGIALPRRRRRRGIVPCARPERPPR